MSCLGFHYNTNSESREGSQCVRRGKEGQRERIDLPFCLRTQDTNRDGKGEVDWNSIVPMERLWVPWGKVFYLDD